MLVLNGTCLFLNRYNIWFLCFVAELRKLLGGAPYKCDNQLVYHKGDYKNLVNNLYLKYNFCFLYLKSDLLTLTLSHTFFLFQ